MTQVIAVDWSGRAVASERFIWTAIVRDGRLVELEDGRDRTETVAALIDAVATEPDTVIGLDFSFSFPAWYCHRQGWRDGPAVWQAMAETGEDLLRDPLPPFWGRAGSRAQTLGQPLRATEREQAGRSGGPRPKSTFQIGGAGAVGTGSIRGMPHLLTLMGAGVSIWPFTRPARPVALEIYPRALTGPVVKGRRASRQEHLRQFADQAPPELLERAAGSEDAFDAAVSALAMARHLDQLRALAWPPSPVERLEGAIWRPGIGSAPAPDGV